MFAPLSRLMAALSRLAGNVEDLAGTVAEMNTGLRGRLQLDGPDQPPAIENEPAEPANGRRGKRHAAL
jgi:hypothetical protein